MDCDIQVGLRNNANSIAAPTDFFLILQKRLLMK